MQVQLFDEVVLDAGSVRMTADGYMVAEARTARTGIQTYRAGELGLTDRDPGAAVRVYRPADQVFAADALRSLANRPITLDHPAEPVTAANWKDLARGMTGAEVVRDGDFVRQPLMLTDAEAIAVVQSGKRQLSQGYSCELRIEAGVTDAGEEYDAVMEGIRGNHLAICSVARGGSDLRIGDTRREAVEPKDGDGKMPHTLIIDGLQVPNVSDEAKAAIEKLQGQITGLTQAKDAAEKQVGELTATIQTKDGEIAGLNAKLKDAEVTPARLAELAASRAKVIDSAKKIAGDELMVDGLDEAAIRRAAVSAKLGDAAKEMSDASIEGAFSALATAAPGVATQAKDGVGAVLANGGTASIGDAAKKAEDARRAADERERNAWKGKAA